MIKRDIKPTTWVKKLGWIFALLGVVLNAGTSTGGLFYCVGEERSPCSIYFFFWWALVVEDVCLVVLRVAEKRGGLGRAYVAVTGLFVFSTTQLQTAAWVMTDLQNTVGVGVHTYVGFAVLFVANLLLVTAMGLEHYVKPKWSEDEACTAVDQETGASPLVPASDPRRQSVLETIWKKLVLAVACVGVAGIVAALVASVNQECDFACVRNWWICCVQLLGFVLFITFEVILNAPAFRPVLTVLLAIQIRMLEWIAIGPPGDDSDSVHGVQKIGVIIAIAVSYILLLSLFGSTTTEPPFHGKTLLWGVVPTAAALVGVILKHQDLSVPFPDFVYSAGWQLAMYLLALIWIILSFVDKMPILLNFRLPLVAFVAITIQWDMLFFYVFTLDRTLLDDTDWPRDSLRDYFPEYHKVTLGLGPILLIISFISVIIVMGISFKGSTGLKSKPNDSSTSQGTTGNYLRGDKSIPQSFEFGR